MSRLVHVVQQDRTGSRCRHRHRLEQARQRTVLERQELVELVELGQVVGRSREYPINALLAKSVPVGSQGLLTFRRYSTARSGLKKAARMAASIWERSKPMASMFAITSALAEPMAIELASPSGAAPAPAGVGVAGGAAVALL